MASRSSAPLRREGVTFLVPENVNHLLKHASRLLSEVTLPEAMARSNAPDASLDPEALASILAWLAAHM
jgi:uncharacterized protein